MSQQHSVDRRDFLKTAAVTGAAALGAGAAAAANDAPQASPPAPSQRARRPTRSRSRRQRRGADHRSAGRRLHGRRHQVARLRVHRLQSRLELPRHSTSRSSTTAATQTPEFITCLPRGVVGGDGARLLQGRRQADGGAVPRHRRHAARGDGDLQRLLRPRAGLHPRRQLARRDAAAAGRGVGAQRAGRGGDGPRLHQVGRPAGLAAALRRVGGARLQDRDDAADDAGAARHRRRPAGRSDLARGQLTPAHPEAHA